VAQHIRPATFLIYLGEDHPAGSLVNQLRRDPHILGWLAHLRSRTAPLAKLHLRLIVRCAAFAGGTCLDPATPRSAHLLGRDDVPRRDHRFRALDSEQDQRSSRNCSPQRSGGNALLLLRHTGMRIGECVDLSVDCLRPLGPDQWVIHVPLGKLGTERWVPVDSVVCQMVQSAPLSAPTAGARTWAFAIASARGRYHVDSQIRAALQDAAAAAGIKARIVPHQFRHTYASEMLRAGVSLPAVMKLLGHKSPHMTCSISKLPSRISSESIRLARSQPRHIAPPPRVPSSLLHLAPICQPDRLAKDRPARLWKCSAGALPKTSARRLLDRLANRLVKIVTEAKKLNTPEK
jgi:integrase